MYTRAHTHVSALANMQTRTYTRCVGLHVLEYERAVFLCESFRGLVTGSKDRLTSYSKSKAYDFNVDLIFVNIQVFEERLQKVCLTSPHFPFPSFQSYNFLLAALHPSPTSLRRVLSTWPFRYHPHFLISLSLSYHFGEIAFPSSTQLLLDFFAINSFSCIYS